ncbi:hypothetical protein M408DRAFT_61157 [Serendipita vermifera MAFF 305830]|uniref:Uncharacterized protein n=1 Tax=Serendipita vermifera MAFF 305830 TaxID=933852 RepID=A0A0C3BP15_SERVB|nr:hypothetical protein M408DRAFT_61157 [Serendipita vermifera MAFF 305830]
MYRTTIIRAARPLAIQSRTLHSTPVAFKTVTEKAKDMAETVNKKVGQGLASVIDKGEQVTQSAKETVGSASEKTKQKTQEGATYFITNRTLQAAAGANEAKEDFKKEMRK